MNYITYSQPSGLPSGLANKSHKKETCVLVVQGERGGFFLPTSFLLWCTILILAAALHNCIPLQVATLPLVLPFIIRLQ